MPTLMGGYAGGKCLRRALCAHCGREDAPVILTRRGEEFALHAAIQTPWAPLCEGSGELANASQVTNGS